MRSVLPDLVPVLVLIALGAGLSRGLGRGQGRAGFLSAAVADGLKRLVASVTLPVLLFVAFARLALEPSVFVLAAVVFASCGVLGLAGAAFSRAARLPRPSTAFLFQGFEAGMLGYALFASIYGPSRVHFFAVADLGQVLYVFTVLMAQLLSGEDGSRARVSVLAGRLLSSPVIVTIGAGLASAALVPGARGLPWAAGAFLDPTLSAIGGLTTPLVCLVVGHGLSAGFPRGALAASLSAVAARLGLSFALALCVAYLVVPALGFGALQSAAVATLFLLPPPFVIAVFRKRPEDAAYVSSVLSLHTVASLAAVSAFALVSGGLR